MAAMKENSKNIFYFVKEHEAEGITAKDIADGLGIGVRQVNGSITSAFCRKGLMERVEKEVTLEDGTHAKIKEIHLTADGLAFDPEAVTE